MTITDKFRIAFVDDEPHILRGIHRSMADMEDEWDMTFCASGQEVLAKMSERPFDVIVSDMRMPQMDGADLLNEVRHRYPETIRVILSGYADSDSVLRTVGPAHAYLAKPCDAVHLRDAIRRQIAVRALLDSPQLRAMLAGLTNLPSLPTLYLQLQAELLSPKSSAKSVAEIIARDVAMTAEILKMTNSAYFSTAGNVSSPLHAVKLLGMDIVQALVLKIGVFRQFAGKPDVAPLLETLTLRSFAIADLAERIAVVEGGDVVQSKSARVAAMLSDIGIVVLLDGKPDEYRRLLAKVGRDGSLSVLEREAFGADHALIGAYLLGVWGFSDSIVEALIYCAHPHACPRRDNLALTALHAATVLGPRMPLLPEGLAVDDDLDIVYLTEAHCADHVPRWRGLATTSSKGEG